MFTSSYVEDGGVAKRAAAIFFVYQGMSAKVKHLMSGKASKWISPRSLVYITIVRLADFFNPTKYA